MKELEDCEFIAIFDADFKPDTDFLVGYPLLQVHEILDMLLHVAGETNF